MNISKVVSTALCDMKPILSHEFKGQPINAPDADVNKSEVKYQLNTTNDYE